MFKIITVTFDRVKKSFDEELINRITLNKQLKSCRVEFFQDGDDAYWTVSLEYDPLLEKTPDHVIEGLDEPQKLLLERLKAWRRERAGKDGVPVYMIGTNREMIDIVKAKPASLEA